ncbi:MAG: GNAT family N-acetyltransferase [Clostridiaceae bacterium]
MTLFTLKNVSNEDHNRYKDFFSDPGMFNDLNIPIKTQNPTGLLSKITGFEVEKLVLKDEIPVFYIGFLKSASEVTINTMLFNKEFLNEDELFKFIKEEILDKKTIFGLGYDFSYMTSDNEINVEVMEKLGFTPEKRFRVMNILLDRLYLTGDQRNLNSEIHFNIVRNASDIRDRVLVQNSAFNNSNRIPLNEEDIRAEMINSTYIHDLSLLMFDSKTPVGYGQIIRSGKMNYLVNFGIHQDMRGKGYSNLLLEELLARTLETGRQSLFLEVYENNIRAVKLYENHGFKTMYRKSLWHYGTEN